MGKAPRASKVPKAAAVVRSVDPKVVEFLEVASAGDVSKVKKIIKAAKFEIDEGKEPGDSNQYSPLCDEVKPYGDFVGSLWTKSHQHDITIAVLIAESSFHTRNLPIH